MLTDDEYAHLRQLVAVDVVLRTTPGAREHLLEMMDLARRNKSASLSDGGHY
jgi:hypothetical protein